MRTRRSRDTAHRERHRRRGPLPRRRWPCSAAADRASRHRAGRDRAQRLREPDARPPERDDDVPVRIGLRNTGGAAVRPGISRPRPRSGPGRGEKDAPAYDAFDPALQLWVAATLYQTMIDLHERVFGPVSTGRQGPAVPGVLAPAVRAPAAARDVATDARGLRSLLGLDAEGARDHDSTRSIARQILYPQQRPRLDGLGDAPRSAGDGRPPPGHGAEGVPPGLERPRATPIRPLDAEHGAALSAAAHAHPARSPRPTTCAGSGAFMHDHGVRPAGPTAPGRGRSPAPSTVSRTRSTTREPERGRTGEVRDRERQRRDEDERRAVVASDQDLREELAHHDHHDHEQGGR